MSKKGKRVVLPVMSVGDVFRWILAGVLLVMTLAQLFRFERFPELLAVGGVPTGLSVTLAIVLVVVGMMSLPWLMAMRLRPQLLIGSIASGVATLGLLTVLEVMAYQQQVTVLFGATLDMPAGGWSLSLLAGLWLMLGFSVADRYRNQGKRVKRKGRI